MTIIQAIQRVLEGYKKPLTHEEIYNHIVEKKLYKFRAKDPLHVVKNTIRRHSLGVDFPTAKNIKYFKIVVDDKNNSKYTLNQGIDTVLNKDKLDINQKTNNIRYFIDIIKIINDNKFLPIREAPFFIEKKLLKEIKASTIKPYFNTLIKLGLIQIINGAYILTKFSNWFLELQKYIKEQYLISPLKLNENEEFDTLEKYFILKTVIKEDFIVLYELLELINSKKTLDLNDLDNIFLVRIKWLKSLNLLTVKNKKIKFTKSGSVFFDNISKQQIVFKDTSTTINTFLLEEFVNTFTKINNMDFNKSNKDEMYIKKYFKICFNLHKSKFHDRVTISSLINSIIILTMIYDNITIEYFNIKSVLINSNFIKKLGYSFNYSVKEEDGYIRKA